MNTRDIWNIVEIGTRVEVTNEWNDAVEDLRAGLKTIQAGGSIE